MTIVPGDRNRVPTLFANSAAISGITLPAKAGALLEVLRFGGGGRCGANPPQKPAARPPDVKV
jgi:hypothetical protein